MNVDWLYRITITCFAASYAVVLALELSRVFFNANYRRPLIVGFTVAGFFAHSTYLFYQGAVEIDDRGIWLSNWTAWCFSAAWILAAAYLWVSLRKSESVIGVFLLPIVMLLIGVGFMLRGEDSFSVREAKSGWNLVHGFSLMLGTVSVVLGFVFGLVYLIQANRLKHKKPQSRRFRLPSLEWLQRCSEWSLVASASLLALGVISGIGLNLVNQNMAGRAGTVAWSDPVVWTSIILFVWLAGILIFNASYQPARQGRKVAYLVVSSFLFLVFELAIVWIAGHAESGGSQVPAGQDPAVVAQAEDTPGLVPSPQEVAE